MRPKSDFVQNSRRNANYSRRASWRNYARPLEPSRKNPKNRKGNQPLGENAETRFSCTHAEFPAITDLLVERKTRVTFLRKTVASHDPPLSNAAQVPPKRRERDSLKTFLETFGSVFEVTNRQPYAPVGTVSGANVIGTLCDIVTREHTTVSL